MPFRKEEKTFLSFVNENKVLFLTLFLVILLICVIYYLEWWEIIGLFILKTGLGIKTHGAKTLGKAIINAGGKKVIISTTIMVLLKRHAIDSFTKYFTEHSFSRYKNNTLYYSKMKMKELKDSPPAKKIKVIGTSLMSIPIVYVFWTKVVSTAFQKLLYAAVIPFFSTLFDFISIGYNIGVSLVTFLFQVTMLNYFIDWISKYKYGEMFIDGVTKVIKSLGNLLDFLNLLISKTGFNPKHFMIVKSIKFNLWLENKLYKHLNKRERILKHREIHINSREEILIRRNEYKENRRKKDIPFKKKVKQIFREKVLKEKNWREKRKERKESFK